MQPNENQEMPQDVAELQKQLEAARAEAAEYKDRFLRAAADMQNFRNLQERRASDRVKQEKRTMLMRIIEVVDDLDRALAYQEVADKATLLASLKHMHSQMRTLLEREGVTGFDAQGEMFDPHVHDAVERIDGSGKPEGEVVQEIQKGYRIGEDLLRPARVNVSSGQDAR